MDIKEKVTEVVEKIKNDPKLLAEFEKEPVKTVEKIVGMDLPDELIEKVLDGIKILGRGELTKKLTVKVPKKKLKAYKTMLKKRGLSSKAKVKK